MKKTISCNRLFSLVLCFCMVLSLLPEITQTASASNATVVATVGMGGNIREYNTLQDAIESVKNCTAEDGAIVNILQDANEDVSIFSGVFTLDLQGNTINGGLYMDGPSYVTIKGSGMIAAGVSINNGASVTLNDGCVSGAGVMVSNGHLITDGGMITGDDCGVHADNSTVTISNSTVDGGIYGLSVHKSTVTISDSEVGGCDYGVSEHNSTVTISGSRVSGGAYGVCAEMGYVSVNEETIVSGDCGVYASYGSTVTISDSTVECGTYGLSVYESTATISDSVVSGEAYGVYAETGYVNIKSGTVISGSGGIYASYGSTVNISNSTVESDIYGLNVYESTVTISGSKVSANHGVYADNSTVTISNTEVSGNYGVYAANSTISVSCVVISGQEYGVYAESGYVSVNGKTVVSGNCGVYASYGSTVTISDSEIWGSDYGMSASYSTLFINGGIISAGDVDICNVDDSDIILTMGKNGVQTTFPSGIKVSGTTLDAILGKGLAYWQDYRQINPAEDATEITDGDVIVSKTCEHDGNTGTDDGDCTTEVLCSVCGKVAVEAKKEHSYKDGACTVCGTVQTFTVKLMDGDTVLDEQILEIRSSYYLPTLDDKDGLCFVGWDADGNGEEDYESGYIDIESDLTLTAVYAKIYTVSFFYADAEGNAQLWSEYGGPINRTIQLDSLEWWNYGKFLGWDADGDGVADYDGYADYTVTGDTALYAVLVPFSAAVELGAEDASFLDADGSPITTIYAESAHINSIEMSLFPSRTGYIFTGWMDTDGTTYTVYIDEQTGKELMWIGFNGDTVLTAQWTLCTAHIWLDANCTAAKTCTACGETEGEALGHSYESGSCTICGAADPNHTPAVTKPTLTLKSPTLEFKDMITVNAFFTAENIADVVEMGMITYSSKVDTWGVDTAEYVIPGATYTESTGRYVSSSQGIHAKYLGDTVYMAVYAKLTDGSYVYSAKLAPYSPVDYAVNQLKNSSDVKLKQLVAAMLNYGAEAQLFFGHNTSALANASLTADQKALPETYRSDMVGSVSSASTAKQGIFANNSGFAERYPAISFEDAFCINYFFTPKYAPASGITLYYWNAEDYNANSVLNTSNATGKIKLEGSGTGEYRGDITGISAKNLSDAVYVAAAYKDSSGTVWTSGVLGYSIGAYCSSQASKGVAVSDLAMATAVYGYHAKQYFG